MNTLSALKTTAMFCLIFLVACGGGGSSSSAPPDSGTTPPPPTSGLDARPSNTSCVAPLASQGSYALQTAFPDLPVNADLVGLYQTPNDATWFYAVHKSGHVYRFANQANVSNKSLFLELSALVRNSGESGLLGLAFHPEYATNRLLFVYYTGGSSLRGVVARYTARTDFASVDMASREEILAVDQPYANHNGGQLSFGPDGFCEFNIQVHH